jgi:type II secretory pathway component GspD/PulD (secretin)
MRHLRISTLTPLMLAMMALPLAAEDGTTPPPATTPTTPPAAQATVPPDTATPTAPATTPAAAPATTASEPTTPQQALDQAGTEPATPDQVLAEARFREAENEYHLAHFVEAKSLAEAALRANPSHQGARHLLSDIEAILGERSNSLQMAATWFKSLQDVRTQELAVRLDGLLSSGDQKMAAGDFAGAELDYDRVEVGLRTFPFQFDWGNLPQDVATKRLEAHGRAHEAEIQHQRDARAVAQTTAQQEASLQEEALANKVDELLRRAKVAYDRKDYKRAEVDAWSAYDLDRRREDARSLYLAARREGHIEFDDHYRTERLERLARVNEEIHKSLIPQSEILVYPEDWQRRSLRKPQQIGNQKEEPWMQALRDRMTQPISFSFADTSFDDVVAYLRQVTGNNIIIDPGVTAGNGVSPITLKVDQMHFGDALKWILELTNLHMALQDHAIYISNKPVTGSIVLKMYDVTDLISPVRDFPGRELAYNAGGSGGARGIKMFGKTSDEEDTKAVDPTALVDFIKGNVAKASWSDDGVAIDQRSGSTLFVSQTPEVHDQIEQLLANLRNQQSLQVHVGVRMLDITKDFYEEIGFSYDDPTTPNTYDLLNSSSTNTPPGGPGQGYIRENQNVSYQGQLNNNLDAQVPNSTTAQASPYNAFGGTLPRGLYVESSHSLFNFFNADQVNAVFQASEEESDSQVLQSPSLTCFNGQRANCSFMTQYAYIQSYDIVSSTLEPEIQVLSFGNVLDVRPVVSSDHKYITMEVRPSSVELVGVFTQILTAPRIIVTGNATFFAGFVEYPIELPNVLVRTMRASVMLPDKSSLLIGGFNRSLRQRTQAGVPFLSNIPFLGRLFTRNGSYDEDAKLFMLLNAEILDLKEKEAQQ